MGRNPHTIVAICYDFDGTLIKGNIQEDSFIPSLGTKKEKFWDEVEELSKNEQMDEVLTYMHLIVEEARKNRQKYRKQDIGKHGRTVDYFQGVEDYFDRINKYAKRIKINLEHYVISSGNKEMIENTSIAKKFKRIFASYFYYDNNEVPIWPAVAVNHTSKTQFLFRINKGAMDISDMSTVNKYVLDDERPIPFKNMIYIGDGESDIPAMKVVLGQGGCAIAVYAPKKHGARKKARELLSQGRASYAAPANYSDGSNLDKIIKATISQIAYRESIARFRRIEKI